jgi:hypothetical protein
MLVSCSRIYSRPGSVFQYDFLSRIDLSTQELSNRSVAIQIQACHGDTTVGSIRVILQSYSFIKFDTQPKHNLNTETLVTTPNNVLEVTLS